jgi:hypothetical protein
LGTVRRVRGSLLMAVVVMGCGPTRVVLGPVTPVTDARSANARYDTYRVEGVMTEELHVGRLALSQLTRLDTRVTSVTLANGAVIEDPRDLIPVAGEGSATAQRAGDWARARERWLVPGTIATVSFTAGFAGLVTSLFVMGSTRSVVPMLISAAVLLVGPLASLGIGKLTLPDLNDLLAKAFRAYVDDLTLMRDSHRPPAPPATLPE